MFDAEVAIYLICNSSVINPTICLARSEVFVYADVDTSTVDFPKFLIILIEDLPGIKEKTREDH